MKELKLKDILGNDGLPKKIIRDELEETDYPWTHFRCIFEHEGKYYALYYTHDDENDTNEIYLEDRFDEDSETLECEEVELRKVLVDKWVEISG